MSVTYRAALYYANVVGLRVFPSWWPDPSRPTGCACPKPDCASPAKHPMVSGWQVRATTDASTIGTWWRRWPRAGVCLPTGALNGVVVLDVDGDVGQATLAEYEEEYGRLPLTPEALTGSGGAHYAFAHPGVRVRNRVKFAPSLDVRGDGGYIVAWPSLHVSGRRYAWQPGRRPNDVPLAAMPGWFLDAVRQVEEQPSAHLAPRPVDAGDPVDRARRYLRRVDPAIEGCGGDTHTLDVVCRVVRGFDLTDEEALFALADWNSRCRPPWSHRALHQKVRNARLYGTEPVGGRLAWKRTG